jgi:predicted TIM-barrel fold metal-dependent hydrolase
LGLNNPSARAKLNKRLVGELGASAGLVLTYPLDSEDAMADLKAASRVIDCDTHFWQPIELWASYIDAEHRDAVCALFGSGPVGEQVPAHVMAKVQAAMAVRGADHTEDRLAWMDSEGIDACVIYPSGMGLLAYHQDPDIAAAACRALNHWCADFQKAAPERLLPCMILPWYYPERALEEFHVAKDLGLKIAFCAPTPSVERRWSDKVYDPLWAAMQDAGVVMTFHEFTRIPGATSNFVARKAYKDQYAMTYLCGHTVEAMLSLMDVLLGGICHRFPRLQIGFVEAHVAWLQGWLEMLDSAWERPVTAQERIDAGRADELSPSAVFKRQCFITAFPDDRGIDLLVERLGSHVVTLSTDYPHPQAIPQLRSAFEAAYPSLPERAKRDILGGSMSRILEAAAAARTVQPA